MQIRERKLRKKVGDEGAKKKREKKATVWPFTAIWLIPQPFRANLRPWIEKGESPELSSMIMN